MRSEQRRLRNNKLAAKKAMGPVLMDLQIWLAGEYDSFSLLDDSTKSLAMGARAWTVGEFAQRCIVWTPPPSCHTCLPPSCAADQLCRGVYPWQLQPLTLAADNRLHNVNVLITRLRRHTADVARAEEEVALLCVERELCLHTYTVQESSLLAAAAEVEAEAERLEAGDPREAAYSAGLALLWRREAAAVQAQAADARARFQKLSWTCAGDAPYVPAPVPAPGDDGISSDSDSEYWTEDEVEVEEE